MIYSEIIFRKIMDIFAIILSINVLYKAHKLII